MPNFDSVEALSGDDDNPPLPKVRRRVNVVGALHDTLAEDGQGAHVLALTVMPAAVGLGASIETLSDNDDDQDAPKAINHAPRSSMMRRPTSKTTNATTTAPPTKNKTSDSECFVSSEMTPM
jgi:hypothetical protein